MSRRPLARDLNLRLLVFIRIRGLRRNIRRVRSISGEFGFCFVCFWGFGGRAKENGEGEDEG